MCLVCASDQPAPPPCGRTRGELDNLRARIKKGELDNADYFFQGSPPPEHLNHLVIKDKLVRCIKCGRTIDEHMSGAAPPVSTMFCCVGKLSRFRCVGRYRELVYTKALVLGARGTIEVQADDEEDGEGPKDLA